MFFFFHKQSLPFWIKVGFSSGVAVLTMSSKSRWDALGMFD
jgi:hypothetical protein